MQSQWRLAVIMSIGIVLFSGVAVVSGYLCGVRSGKRAAAAAINKQLYYNGKPSFYYVVGDPEYPLPGLDGVTKADLERWQNERNTASSLKTAVEIAKLLGGL